MKRYQDVYELLDAGINVIGAFNIQHLESLKDIVEQATDIRVRESVPDTFLQQADQVVNLDLAVEDLLERMRAGKIYAEEKVARSLASFFQEEKLSALRELALREVAESLGRAAAVQNAAGEPVRPRGEPARHGLHLVALAPHRGAAAAGRAPRGAPQHRLVRGLGGDARARPPTGSTRPRSACSTTTPRWRGPSAPRSSASTAGTG